jgi:alkaline phosphatase
MHKVVNKIIDDRNLVNEFKAAGFQYIDNYNALNNINSNKPLFGLFADRGLPWALDDENKHRLSALTKVATKHLENDNGYFMLIEASQIDWAGHSNDIASAMAEMDDLAKTLEYLEVYVKENPNTLVVLTADHSTGGFTLAKDGKYEWKPDVLRTMKMSSVAIAKQISGKDFDIEKMSALFNFTLTTDVVITLADAKTDAFTKVINFELLDEAARKNKRKPQVERIMHKVVNKIIDDRTNTGWTSGGHTAIDVPIFAFGHQSDAFSGQQDNTDIAKKIFTLLGKK